MSDDAQTVRDTISRHYAAEWSERINALAAHERILADRDRLAARVAELEAERDEWKETARFTETIRNAGCDCGDDESCAWLRRAETAEARVEALTEALREIAVDERRLAASLIAVKPHLILPYPDDPRWTPWTRFVERKLHFLHDSVRRAVLAAADRPEETMPPGERWTQAEIDEIDAEAKQRYAAYRQEETTP